MEFKVIIIVIIVVFYVIKAIIKIAFNSTDTKRVIPQAPSTAPIPEPPIYEGFVHDAQKQYDFSKDEGNINTTLEHSLETASERTTMGESQAQDVERWRRALIDSEILKRKF